MHEHIIKRFQRSGTGIVLLFSAPALLQKSNGSVPPSAGALYINQSIYLFASDHMDPYHNKRKVMKYIRKYKNMIE